MHLCASRIALWGCQDETALVIDSERDHHAAGGYAAQDLIANNAAVVSYTSDLGHFGPAHPRPTSPPEPRRAAVSSQVTAWRY